MTNRARMYLRYRDLDIPASWEGATRERGRPARNLIRASSLRSRGIPSNRAPNRPLQGSLLWCQVLCGRDARAPGGVPPATLFVQAACDPGAFPRTVHQTAFAGFATMVPSPMRARRPRSRVGVLPFTLAPQESVSGCRAAALPCRSCERASCNIGSGTGRFAGNRDVLPISIVGCDLVKKAHPCVGLCFTWAHRHLLPPPTRLDTHRRCFPWADAHG